MGVSRPYVPPTLGLPSPVRLTGRRAGQPGMDSPAFYDNPSQAYPNNLQMYGGAPTMGATSVETPGQQLSTTQDYFKQRMQNAADRTPPPRLDPSSRVRFADHNQISPNLFQAFYDQINAITDAGQHALAAAQARSAAQRMHALNVGSTASYVQNQQNHGSVGSGGGAPPSNIPRSVWRTNPGIPSNYAPNFQFAKQIAPRFGWTSQKELSAWYALGMLESGWVSSAQNPTSTAFGIGQFLNSTWSTVGMQKTSDPRLQVLAMAKYIRQRYGSPSNALAFHNRKNWY